MQLEKDSLGFLLADVSRLMRRAFQLRMDGNPLTHAQARALVHIARHEGIRQVELADQLEVQPITLARLLDQLAEQGLVERRADPADRRAYRLFLAPDASGQLATLDQVAQAVRAQALSDISPEHAAVAQAVLRQMRANLAAPPRRLTKDKQP